MKKTIIVNIPMKIVPQKKVYVSTDLSLPVSNRKTAYTVLSFLEKTMVSEDEIKFVLLAKRSINSKWEQRIAEFKEEAASVNGKIGATVDYVIVESDFGQSKHVYEKLMESIVDQIENDSRIIADITYGPEDLSVVIFSALSFAEKFLGCVVDHILYGQEVLNDAGQIVNSSICDLSSLYALNSLANTIKCDDPEKARKMLKTIVSL